MIYFECQPTFRSRDHFIAPFVGTIDRAAGTVMVGLVPFVHSNMIAAASGSTHFKIISAGAEIEAETLGEKRDAKGRVLLYIFVYNIMRYGF
jgi:hypothetical protein